MPRSRAIAECPTDKVKVEVLTEDVTGLGEVGVAIQSSEAGDSAVMVLLLVVTAAPFKLFTRAAALLRGVVMRFLGKTAPVEVSLALGQTLGLRFTAVLMLAVDVKVDTPDAVSVVTDAPCDCRLQLVVFTQAGEVVDGSLKGCVQPEEADVMVLSELALLKLISWRISGLLRRPCCCCSSVVVPPGAASVFPK